jgi:hypothetical protein
MGERMAYWGYAREKSWYTPLRTPPIDGLSVLGKAEKKSHTSTLDAFKVNTANFSAVV